MSIEYNHKFAEMEFFLINLQYYIQKNDWIVDKTKKKLTKNWKKILWFVDYDETPSILLLNIFY